MPTQDSIPPDAQSSGRSILKSTVIAALVATAVLITIVLPAEYGIDPIGVGRVLGLKEMGETKRALAKDEGAHAAEAGSATTQAPPIPAQPAAAAATTDSAVKSDVAEVVLLPNEGKEIKLAMRKDARVNYSWSTTGGAVNYDTHADSPTIKYHGYKKGSSVTSDEGVLTAAFDGKHGWFWRNRTKSPVTVTLRTQGDYQELQRM